jgi:hypothetical protein
MDHAITIGNVLLVSGIALAGILAIGGLILLITIMNPFRSGH